MVLLDSDLVNYRSFVPSDPGKVGMEKKTFCGAHFLREKSGKCWPCQREW